MHLVTLDTPRLVLRPFGPEDEAFFRTVTTDPALMAHMNGVMTAEKADPLFARLVDPDSELRAWVAEERGTGERCAHGVLRPPVSEKDLGLELVYLVTTPYQGRGIATEMVGRLAAYAFGALRTPQLVASVDEDHVASRRVLERLGFSAVRADRDKQGPVAVYTMTRDAWVARDHQLPPEAKSAAGDTVVRRFLDGERLVRIPAKHTKRMAVLAWLAERFELGRVYSELEVNAVLKRHHEDVASLRRHLVDHGFLSRERSLYTREVLA